MIHIQNNECPVCLTDNLSWNLNICNSDMQMFKCGHGTCKSCYIKLRNINKQFSCPLCCESDQQFSNTFCSTNVDTWVTFADWYNDYEIYIKSGSAKNVVIYSAFGKQLLRLIKENKTLKNKTLKNKTLK